jgi:Domain of Unknown Function (DUF1206)
MVSEAVKGRARRAGDSTWVERLGRIGLATKGVSFVLVGVLALLVAAGAGGRPTDREGALRLISEQSYGALILIALALGFGSYAVWRFAQAFLDRDDDGNDLEGFAKRAGCAVKGVLYLVLAAISIGLLTRPRGESASEPEWTHRVLQWPAGTWLVGAFGVGLIGYGLWNGYRSLTGKYRKDMKTHEMERPVRKGMEVVGSAGHIVRMVLFGLVGVFLVRAAYQYDPSEAIGIDGALTKLAQQPYGPWWLGAAAAGLIAYGIFALIQARYRDV